VPTLQDYHRAVTATDRRPAVDALKIAVFGLFGETGSILSEIKKHAREGDAYRSFGSVLVEELGDLLWYYAALASSLGVSLDTLFARALGLAIGPTTTFDEIDVVLSNEASRTTLVGDPWMRAAAAIGNLTALAATPEKDNLLKPAIEALRTLVTAAHGLRLRLSEAADANLAKVSGRWPKDQVLRPLYDDDPSVPVDERLLRNYAVDFQEITVRGKKYVVQKVFTLKIGDPLTDNITESDDYRFHDVFHFAYSAVLGWSPVLRSLFKVKRKSDPDKDENEDGARAILIEEGIASWVFSRAKEIDYFDGVQRVDYSIIKTIADFVRGYEVEDQPFWAWERAILQGYDVFRELKARRKGRVQVNLLDREIRFEPIA